MPNNKNIYNCLYNHLSAFTAYKKGCRCSRCLLNQRKSSRLSAKKQRQNPNKKAKQSRYNKLWFQRNKDKKKKYDKRYYQKHLTKIKKYKKKYYLQNKSKIIQKVKTWIDKNLPKHKFWKTQWNKKNTHILNALNAKRRIKIKTQQKQLTKTEKQQVYEIYKQCKALNKKTKIEHHVDHIIPISKGGKHHPSNLQILTAKENLHKSSKLV